MEQKIETADSSNGEDVVVEDVNASGQELETIETLTEKNKKLFARAKKAEGFDLVDGKWVKATKPAAQAEVVPSQNNLSVKDGLFLAKADVHEDDIDELVEFANLKKLPLSDAYKVYRPILDTKAEERRTAAASHTKGAARGTSKVTGEDLLRKAETTGEVPTTTEGMQDLFTARRARRAGK